MNYIDVINNYGENIKSLKTMKKFITYCADKLKLNNVMFNVIIVGNEEIHQLNKKYRGIDNVTDVITFALEDYKDGMNLIVRVLGDVYISYDKVKEQALMYGHSEQRELCFLTIHGILHLLGYDHMNKEDEQKMFSLQKELLDGYGIKKES